MTIAPKSSPKIVSVKGRKQGLLTSGERGQLVTTVVCADADGYIFTTFQARANEQMFLGNLMRNVIREDGYRQIYLQSGLKDLLSSVATAGWPCKPD